MSSTGIPYTTGPAGGTSESSPTVNHVERSPSASLSFDPGTVSSPRVAVTVTEPTRPDAFAVGARSSTAPGAFSSAPSFTPVNATGPQSWYGEIVSYGSATGTRYGSGFEPCHSSWIAAVRPPEVE